MKKPTVTDIGDATTGGETMKRYRYRISQVKRIGKVTEESLTEFSAKGWHLIAVAHTEEDGTYFYFRKEVEEG
jgi:hypothetical protein